MALLGNSKTVNIYKWTIVRKIKNKLEKVGNMDDI